MPVFHYTALDANGQETAGTIDASNQNEATLLLRQQQFYVTDIQQEGKGDVSAIQAKVAKVSKAKGRANVKPTTAVTVKSKTLMIFTRQLATLIDSGLPLLRGLTVLSRQEPVPAMKKTIGTLAESVQTGSTFSESLAQYPRIFNKLYINMVKAGELGGVLEVVLNRLAEYQEKAQKLKNKVVAAMVYPVIVMFIAVIIVIFLMMFIVPKFQQIFADMQVKLPALTQFVMDVSDGIVGYGAYMAVGCAVFYLFWMVFAKSVVGRKIIDRAKLNLPLFGDVNRKTSIARFTRTLGTLVTSGVPILQAINITRETAGNVIISDAINKVHDAVKEGESMVTPLEGSGVFPPMVISMVDVGEETGQLPEMLLKVADVYEDEVDNSVSALTSLLEPIMIVCLAVVVGVIVLALFWPMVTLISNMQNQ
jgi:type IV pilus assembly protein PilC